MQWKKMSSLSLHWDRVGLGGLGLTNKLIELETCSVYCPH